MSPLQVVRQWSWRSLLTAGLVALAGALAVGVALAIWIITGAGVGTATATSLNPPTNVNASASFNTVSLTWVRPTPPSATLAGFYVQRDSGGTLTGACGTTPGTPATYLAGTASSCSDTLVPNGNYTYYVTAVWRSWSSTSNPSNSIVVNGDANPPSQIVSLGTGPTNALFAANRLYYRPDLAGSFTLRNTITDAGSGPASTTFPAIGATGWTHPAQTVTSGTGSPPTVTYTSSTYSWVAGAAQPAAQTIAGRDLLNNQVTTIVSFVPDSIAPASGAITVNGVAATSGGSTSYRTNTNTFTITRTDFTETQSATQSGLLSSVLTRQTATLSNGVCGTFGTATTLTGAPAQTGLTTNCYRYTLTGTDNLGNVASVITTVIIDTSAPTRTIGQTAAVNAAFSASRNRVYYRSAVAGSFQMTNAVTDAQSGPASATFPATTATGWTHAADTVTTGTGAAPTITYTSSTYSWTAGASRPANATFTGRNAAGGTITNNIRFRPDDTAPTGGALTVNGTAGTTAGATSTNTSGSWTITRTDYTETQTNTVSGLSSSVLTRETAPLSGGVCGTYGAPTVLTGGPAQTGVAGTCYRFRLTGTDNVGNSASLTVVVRVAPGISAVQLQNAAAGTAGRLGIGDRAVVTFSRALNPQSLCSAWGTSGNQSLSASNDVTVTLTNAASDTLTVTAGSCTFNFGSIALGSGNYTTANATFVGAGGNASTITWTAATNTLTITLGATTSGSLGTVGSSAATYTPSAAITDPFGLPVSGTFTTGTVQQF